MDERNDVTAASPGDRDLEDAAWIDVRRPAAFAESTVMLPGSRWRDPAAVTEWMAELDPKRPVLVYCVHGHEVSQSTARRLREAGFDARYLAGGIEGWRASGRSTVDKDRG